MCVYGFTQTVCFFVLCMDCATCLHHESTWSEEIIAGEIIDYEKVPSEFIHLVPIQIPPQFGSFTHPAFSNKCCYKVFPIDQNSEAAWMDSCCIPGNGNYQDWERCNYRWNVGCNYNTGTSLAACWEKKVESNTDALSNVMNTNESTNSQKSIDQQLVKSNTISTNQR